MSRAKEAVNPRFCGRLSETVALTTIVMSTSGTANLLSAEAEIGVNESDGDLI